MNGKSDFTTRRMTAQKEINALDKVAIEAEPKREGFFNAVYERADGDGAAVPWADFAAKPQLTKWLSENPINHGTKSAVDVACGLGDHAEAMAAAGYRTTGFDIAPAAIEWVKERFPDTSVGYQLGDLFELPKEWVGGFDLVYECYTIQAVPEELHGDISKAIASLVAPGGTLLALARTRAEAETASGPPWHLKPSEYSVFKDLGFVLESESIYQVERPNRSIPHVFNVWRCNR